MKTIRPALASLFLLLAVLLGLSFTGGLSAGPDLEPIPWPVWRQEVPAAGVAFYYMGAPALALDPAGRPHIVYGQNALFHSWFDGAAWRAETLVPPPATMLESAIAINGAGRITIVYNLNSKVYMLAREPGEPWSPAVALPIPAGHYQLSLALDSGGRPRVAAGFPSGATEAFFHLASETPAGWAVETVSAAGPADGAIRLALDSQDRPVVLYAEIDSSVEGGRLYLARRNGGVWLHDQVAAGCIISSKSLALDDQDKAHIVYSEHCDRKLSYAREGDGVWEILPVAEDGVSPSLALDGLGRPHVVYGDYETGQMYAVLTDAGWQAALAQPGLNAGTYNTLVLDEAGTAHIASINADPSYAVNAVEYATNAGGTWRIDKVAEPLTLGAHNALALDSTDTPYVFFDNAQAGELWWGVKTNMGWMTEHLADAPTLYLKVSAAVDTQDRPYVAYANAATDELVVGIRQGGAWSLETVGPAGHHLALAVGSDDNPRLIQVRDSEVTYWFKEGNAWASEPVGGPNNGVWNAWLAIDSQDRSHVVYSGSGGPTHAVRQPDGEWAVEALPFQEVRGIALGPADKLYVLHTTWPGRGDAQPAYSNTTLWVAERAGVSWVDTPLAEYTNWWNLRAWLAVGADDGVYVVYRDVYGALHFRERDENGDWPAVPQAWGNGEEASLLVGQDGQPRLLTHDAGSLVLWTREILLLDKFALLPVAMK